MTRVVVLVRGINVGRSKQLAMADLSRVLGAVGGTDVVTYLRSGNAVMDVAGLAPTGGNELAGRIERALVDTLDLDVSVLVRTGAEVAAVVAGNPFGSWEDRPKQLHVAFTDRTPDAEIVEQVGLRHGDDEIAVGDRALYLRYSGASHDSPLIAPMRRLGVVMTARNWTTVKKLEAMST